MAAIDSRSGYCATTRTFHSLLSPAPSLPPPTLPLSFPAFAFSLLPSPLPSEPALIDSATAEAVSYPAFLSRVRALAAALRSELRVPHGDVALILAPNSVDVPVLIFALLSIGAVASPVKPTATAGEVAHIVGLSKPSVAFAVSATATKLPAGLPVVLLDAPEFQEWLRREHNNDTAVVVHQLDTAAILYSSGTTGDVKAVALSHGSFISALAILEHARRLSPAAANRSRALHARPVATSMAFSQVMSTLALGDTLVVMGSLEEEFGDVMRAVERHQVTDITVGPPVVAAMARGQAVGMYVSSLRRVVCGGAALPVPALVEFRRRFRGMLLGVGYGSTEAGPTCIKFNHDDSSRLASVGHLNHHVQAKIVDQDSGELLPANRKGELHVISPYVMKGYVGNDKANSRAFDSDGWFKTGDLCYIDQDGFLFIVDRIKDLIIYNGYKVEPAELEQLLYSIPGITDAAVIPFPHEELGDIPTALIVREKGSNVSGKDIMDHVANQVPQYRRIQKVIFVSSIPRPPSGKTMRRELLGMVKDGHGIDTVRDIGLEK